MKKELEARGKEKLCGNCRYHNTFSYPDKIFCFAKFQKRDNPVVSTLDSCNQWESKLQDCFCLEDTLKNQQTKTK